MLEKERPHVVKTLEEIDQETALHQYDQRNVQDRRRAAVFYIDKGKALLYKTQSEDCSF